MKVLFVCLGNICRSPTAEGVLRVLARSHAPDLDWRIDSAGTADYHVGEPPDRRTQAVALARGYDLSALRARQVTVEDFLEFEHVFAMDAQNLRALQRLAARAGAGAARPQLFLQAAGVRTRAPDYDVPDPYYGTAQDFEGVLELIEEAARRWLTQRIPPRG